MAFNKNSKKIGKNLAKMAENIAPITKAIAACEERVPCKRLNHLP